MQDKNRLFLLSGAKRIGSSSKTRLLLKNNLLPYYLNENIPSDLFRWKHTCHASQYPRETGTSTKASNRSQLHFPNGSIVCSGEDRIATLEILKKGFAIQKHLLGHINACGALTKLFPSKASKHFCASLIRKTIRPFKQASSFQGALTCEIRFCHAP